MYKSKNITQAAILVGGLGSRLRKVTKNTPKPLVKFNFKPFINYLIEYYEANGFTEILLLCSYKYTLFKKKYHNKKFRNIKIKCIEQKIPNGNLRALKIAYKFLKQDFLLCNGDTFININLKKIKNYYFSKKKNKIISHLNKL
jgi:NDP-sugar pyrophosphorylase family protein